MGEVFSELGVINRVGALKNCTDHYLCQYSERDTSDTRTEPGLFKVEIQGNS